MVIIKGVYGDKIGNYVGNPKPQAVNPKPYTLNSRGKAAADRHGGVVKL